MTLTLSPAQDSADFALASRLLEEMRAWDIASTVQATGSGFVDAVEENYAVAPGDLRQAYARPGAVLLLARDLQGQALGCLGFGPVPDGAGDMGEVQKFYVREAARGQGVGRALLRAVLDQMRQQGYRRAVLETARFMTSAIALYRGAGFQPCLPFRPALDDQSLFFDRML